MELRRFDDAAAFYRRAEGFLLRHEAHHNLILGVCTTVMRHPERFEQPLYLVTLEEREAVVAVALMTPPHNLVLSLMAPAAVSLIASDLHGWQDVPGVVGPGDAGLQFAREWQRISGRAYRRAMAQRIYRLEAITPVSGVPGELRRAAEADRALVIAWMVAFNEEALHESDPRMAERAAAARLSSSTGALYFWDDGGQPVSLAGCTGPTPNGMRVGPVYTPPEQRGKGYASALVAAVSQLVLDGGRRYCFLFTDLDNPTSNHIYQAIGYRAVCDVDEYRFAPDV